MRGWSHPLGSIRVSTDRDVLAAVTREAPVPDDAEQSDGLKAGHMTPARCPSTYKITNASENVAGEILTSIKTRLSPVNLAVIVVQHAALSSDARANSNSGLMRNTRSNSRTMESFFHACIECGLQQQCHLVLPPGRCSAARLWTPPPPP